MQMFAFLKWLYIPQYTIHVKLSFIFGFCYINPNPYIYYTYVSEVCKHLKTCCQIAEQPRKCPGFSIKRNLCTYLWGGPWKFHVYGSQYALHDNNTCFICLLRPYILSFLLVRKMEYEHLMKWSCPF